MKSEATNQPEVTFERVANGIFSVYVNGLKTEWEIINGCLGSSGNGRNLYGISRPDANLPGGCFVRWIGSLAACKKTLKFTLTKTAK
jgi:hypothetical protein